MSASLDTSNINHLCCLWIDKILIVKKKSHKVTNKLITSKHKEKIEILRNFELTFFCIYLKQILGMHKRNRHSADLRYWR